MADAGPVLNLPRPLPASIPAAQNMTPNEMRSLKGATGRTLTDLLGGDPEDMDKAPDRLQSLVWIALKRAGYQVTWDQAGDVAVEQEPEPDPTPTGSSSESSTSAGSGA